MSEKTLERTRAGQGRAGQRLSLLSFCPSSVAVGPVSCSGVQFPKKKEKEKKKKKERKKKTKIWRGCCELGRTPTESAMLGAGAASWPLAFSSGSKFHPVAGIPRSESETLLSARAVCERVLAAGCWRRAAGGWLLAAESPTYYVLATAEVAEQPVALPRLRRVGCFRRAVPRGRSRAGRDRQKQMPHVGCIRAPPSPGLEASSNPSKEPAAKIQKTSLLCTDGVSDEPLSLEIVAPRSMSYVRS